LIEVGRESRLSWATRRAADALGGMAAILVLVWLARGLLGIGQYSADILLASFGLIFLGRVFSTKTSVGAGRAVSSFLWNLAASSIIIILLIWFLGWVASVQSNAFPASISSRVPDLVIAAIATGLGAYAMRKLSSERRRVTPAQPVFVVPEGTGPAMGGARIAVKHDTVGMPIRREGRTIGCILLGDISTSFETPMGTVSASLAGPVTAVGIPFQGRRIDKTEVVKMTGKTPKQLVEENYAGTAVLEPLSSLEGVDLPFVHVRKDDFEEDVEVGPIKVRHGPDGERVKIGPVTIDSDEEHISHGRWLARGVGDSYLRKDGNRISAKWNGSSLSLEDNSMKLGVGSDSFSYSPTEVKTASPLHSLRATQGRITLDTRKFTLEVSGDNVVLRTEDKTSSTESKALASDLRTLLTEAAKKQVRDVMEGTPIDLSEMLAATEEVLARHG
jgi:hypothetical protein